MIEPQKTTSKQVYQLRDYQKEAVARTLHYFRRVNDPAVVVLPTGAGKSLVIAELARVAKGRVLVLAHVKELVEQNHAKYESYGLEAGIYSASLNQKDSSQKVIFGSIQSVANASDNFFNGFTLLIVDECHRIGMDSDTQYRTVITKLKTNNPQLCVLGLTATPYRMGMGWIYNHSVDGVVRTKEERFFKRCIYELPLRYMIQNKYLTPPVKIDIPVTSYDFSELFDKNRRYTQSEVEEVLKQQKRLTPLIIKNIVDITENYDRQGVMVFAGSVRHAEEILEYLPEGQARIVVGDTNVKDRESIINDFKDRKFKYLVNVSVLTTGFDAPHVDVIAILRPTESVSLYQQIIGRGLRLENGKTDCFILDYAGIGHDVYSPEIDDNKPAKESVAVQVTCPQCGFENDFWGRLDDDGELIEHYGRKCRGGITDPDTYKFEECGYRFRSKRCGACSTENDISARNCIECGENFVDPETKLKQARLSKNAHVMVPDSTEFLDRKDKNGNAFLEIRYYDLEANHISEFHFLNNVTSRKKFNIDFLRSHLRIPELKIDPRSPAEVIGIRHLLRMPSYIIARKKDKFWKLTEKIFIEELSRKQREP
ncbi:MAG: ATP-dependent helicase [Bdellovibrionaceae bacterium]|nr:ATP-dependent helicase [Pseudobdellovibrionaceae bacterium]|tara:strand:+ start:40312 stop:42102 length:1791 start_codon:yes stop_codon:yes gene_type:complete